MNAHPEAKKFVIKVGVEVWSPGFGNGVVQQVTDANSILVRFATHGPRRVPASLLREPPATAAKPSLPLLMVADLAGRPVPRREFLDGAKLFPMRNVTLLYGDGGTGKSLLAMQLATSVALGRPWLGVDIEKPGIAYYFSAEDDEGETHIRLSEIAMAECFELASLTDLGISIMAGLDAVLATENTRSSMVEWTPLFDQLRSLVEDNRPSVVVLDNLADIFSGNENVRGLARQVIGKLRGLAIAFDCAVIVLAHPSQSGMNSGSGTSGNSAWSNSVRSRLFLRRDYTEDGRTELNPNRRVLETMKANYGPRGGQIVVEWQGGRFICPDAATETGKPVEPAMRQMRAERVFKDLLRWHADRDSFVSPNKSVSYAPTVFARHPMAEGVKTREFENAMNMLLDRREIEIYTHGSPSSRRQHIGFPFGREEVEN